MMVSACRTASSSTSRPTAPIVQPGAPGESSRVLPPEKAADLPQPGFTAADVRFMQGMIGHHAQAIEMTDLLRTRTNSEEMRKLAMRIEVSQADEIKMMQHWLEARGQEVPGPARAHQHQAAPRDRAAVIHDPRPDQRRTCWTISNADAHHDLPYLIVLTFPTRLR